MVKISGKTVVVVGGAGFIGSNLVERLAKDNKVYVIDNMHTGSVDNLKEASKTGNVKLIKADARQIQNLGFDADYIFHLGFPSSTPMYRKDPHLMGTAITGMISTLEYAHSSGATLVYASTSSIYNGIAPPHKEDALPAVTDYYTEARIAVERIAELYAKDRGVTSTGLRFFSVYGKNEKSKGGYANLVTQFVWWMKKGERPVIYGNGKQRRDFVFAEDVVEALIKASGRKSGHDVFNVGTGKNYDLNEVIEKINASLGTDIEPKYVKMPINNYVMETLAHTKKAEQHLDFKAKHTLDHGIAKVLQYY